ncbi:MAG: hypothetical protein HC888_08195 [Candidatus Competibacteraceae bacterium]|nr:hypothetical protein [Candidatus Competibacteraceae bacterium]
MTIASAFTATHYIEDVLSGRQVACRWVKLAVERHVRDLGRVGNGDFPYYFDESQAERAIGFVQQLRHTKGVWADPRKNDPHIRLEPWQQFIFWNVYGWRRLDGGRRFSKVYLEVARKNGKTTKAAAAGNYAFFGDRPREIRP